MQKAKVYLATAENKQKIKTKKILIRTVGQYFFCFNRLKAKKQASKMLCIVFLGIGIYLFTNPVNATTENIQSGTESAFFTTNTTGCSLWEDARSGSCGVSAYRLSTNGYGGSYIGKFNFGGEGWYIGRGAFNFDLNNHIQASSTILSASLTIPRDLTHVGANSGHGAKFSLYVSDVSHDDSTPMSSSDYDSLCGSTHVTLASDQEYTSDLWDLFDNNTFILNSAGINGLSSNRFEWVVFCLKEKNFDNGDVEPPADIGDQIYFGESILLSIETNETGQPSNIGSYGLNIPDYWSCCFGYCSTAISMPAQLGWWGIGSSTQRILTYTINSQSYTADFSSTTYQNINIPSSTPLGFYNMVYSLKIGDEVVSTSTQQVEIIAGDACSQDNEEYLKFCELPCAGIATSTNPLDFNNFTCGLRKFGCWLFKVDPSAITKTANNWNVFLHRFPLAPVTKLIDNVSIMATGTPAMAKGTINIPYWSSSTKNYQTNTFTLYTATTTLALTKFRRFEVIAMWWILCVIPISAVIILLIL